MNKQTKIYAYKPQINVYVNNIPDFKALIEEKFMKSQMNKNYVFPRIKDDLSEYRCEVIKTLPIRRRTNTEPNQDELKKTSQPKSAEKVETKQLILKGSLTERKSVKRTIPQAQLLADQIIKQFELYKRNKRLQSAGKSLSRIRNLLQKQYM
ncbi:unnamed protein product [Paramecium sonneborni]|uniref:Uncharacterized protein n=1 Tax=Paramecium sonneborni TaxID=65129 RepID=A0A8S1Q3U0_9CILI|nr:unnamed protein product [Paramecium sonneborni]